MHVAAWCRGTTDQSSPDTGNKCRMARSLTLPNFIALGKTMYEKRVTTIFFTFSILAPQGDLLSQSSPVLALVYSMALSRSVYDIIAAKFRRLRCTDDKKTLNDMSPHTIRRQKLTNSKRTNIFTSTSWIVSHDRLAVKLSY